MAPTRLPAFAALGCFRVLSGQISTGITYRTIGNGCSDKSIRDVPLPGKPTLLRLSLLPGQLRAANSPHQKFAGSVNATRPCASQKKDESTSQYFERRSGLNLCDGGTNSRCL